MRTISTMGLATLLMMGLAASAADTKTTRRAPSDSGAPDATLKNSSGVRITLHTTSQGIEAKAAPEGVKITLE
jgi:hypothetical protein